jgi:hypothetical protein
MDPWAELVALAERERELAHGGRWEELAELSTEVLRRSHALGPAPESARPALERLSELQSQIHAAIVSAGAFNRRELADIRRGRAAVRGYGASVGPAPSRVNSLR